VDGKFSRVCVSILYVCVFTYTYVVHIDIYVHIHIQTRLARAALGDGSWNIDNNDKENEARAADRVRALITVGAIHKPPAGDAASTCVTRGELLYSDLYVWWNTCLRKITLLIIIVLCTFIRCSILFR